MNRDGNFSFGGQLQQTWMSRAMPSFTLRDSTMPASAPSRQWFPQSSGQSSGLSAPVQRHQPMNVPNSFHYPMPGTPIAPPAPAPEPTPEPCRANPMMVFTAAAAAAGGGAIAGAKSGSLIGIAAGAVIGGTLAGAAAMTRDAISIQECLSNKPKP